MKSTDATKKFKEFYGRESTKKMTVEIGDFESVTELGEALAIEYKARKHDDDKEYGYRHEFSKGAKLFYNGNVLIIYNPKMTVTERGIVK